jgi:Fe-S cluster assembly protein SufB
MELSTYFRINEKVGQFERTLIIAEENSSLSYLEGCTAPSYEDRQFHFAVVELVAMDNAFIKYSTIQNWFSGPVGGVYNFVTKRGLCKGTNSKISWTQVELGSAITWKYPSCILKGKKSKGEFYSVAVTDKNMQADTGTKMIHLAEDTSSVIISKSIASDSSKNSYRGVVKIDKKAKNSRNFSRCDSMLFGKKSSVYTFPHIESNNNSSKIEHEAFISKINEEIIFYLQARGISKERAIGMVVNGFFKEIFEKIPFEFAIEARELLNIKLKKAIG